MDSISKQIIRSEHFLGKALIGGLLIYSLLGIPLFIGYLARYLRQIKETGGDFSLPAWNHWVALLIESWELLLVVIAYGVFPLGLTLWFSTALSDHLGVLWPIAWLPVSAVSIYSISMICLAYYKFLESDNIRNAFELKTLFAQINQTVVELFPQLLLFWGACAVGFPVYGVTIAVTSLLFFPSALMIIDSNR